MRFSLKEATRVLLAFEYLDSSLLPGDKTGATDINKSHLTTCFEGQYLVAPLVIFPVVLKDILCESRAVLPYLVGSNHEPFISL
jgi:hypothetical protein